MRQMRGSSKVDTVGMISSGLCAVHCAALPLLLYFGVIGGISSSAHYSAELVALICSIGLGAWSTTRGLRLHGKILPQLFIGGGLCLLIFGFLSEEHIWMAIGGLLVVGGHWTNNKYQISIQ